MKDRYRIGEISRMFGIGIDSLRCYERLGVLHPRRADNGYRTYGLDDMYKLSIIKELRGFDFPMRQIRDYLDRQSIETTRELVAQETDLIDRQIAELTERRRPLAERDDRLRRAQGTACGEMHVEEMPARSCVELSVRMRADDEMDLAIKRLQARYERQLPHISTLTIGGALSRDAIERGGTNVYDAVFFVVDTGGIDADFTLPAGPYLTCWYRGPYEQNGPIVRAMLAWARERGREPSGGAFEIYAIDNRDTRVPEEFLTRIEIPLEPARPARA